MGAFFAWAGEICRCSLMGRWFSPTSAWRGFRAEKQACRYLRHRGLRLLKSRYRCCFGELDLIMCDAHVIVFVEVRYRVSLSHGGALLSIDRAKRAKLQRTAEHYLQAFDPYHEREVRFDIVAIEKKQQPHWLVGAFLETSE